jgi:uncharacterized protein YggE
MTLNGKQFIVAVAALALVAAVAVSGTFGVPQAAAQTTTPGTITVLGNGEASGAPDIAYVMLGVEIRNESLGNALGEANTAISAVIEAVRGLGVAAEDIQTLDFSVWSEESYSPDGQMMETPRFFRVSNIVRITARDTGVVQALIDAAVTAGANRIQGVTFGLDNQAALESEARLAALADARDRAQQIADAIGVTLGEPTVVTEGGSLNMPYGVMEARGMGGGGGIQQGQLSVSVQVQVTFETAR